MKSNISGMLWYDNDKSKNFSKRLSEGESWFLKKYGVKPKACEVNIKENIKDYDGDLTVTPKKNILPNHYFFVSEHGDIKNIQQTV